MDLITSVLRKVSGSREKIYDGPRENTVSELNLMAAMFYKIFGKVI